MQIKINLSIKHFQIEFDDISKCYLIIFISTEKSKLQFTLNAFNLFLLFSPYLNAFCYEWWPVATSQRGSKTHNLKVIVTFFQCLFSGFCL